MRERLQRCSCCSSEAAQRRGGWLSRPSEHLSLAQRCALRSVALLNAAAAAAVAAAAAAAAGAGVTHLLGM